MKKSRKDVTKGQDDYISILTYPSLFIDVIVIQINPETPARIEA